MLPSRSVDRDASNSTTVFTAGFVVEAVNLAIGAPGITGMTGGTSRIVRYRGVVDEKLLPMGIARMMTGAVWSMPGIVSGGAVNTKEAWPPLSVVSVVADSVP